MLYNYFADKTELLLAAPLRSYQNAVERFDASLPDAGAATVEENLVKFARAQLELQSAVLPIMTGLISEPKLRGRFMDEMHRLPLGPQHTMQRLIDYVQAEQRLGHLSKAIDPDAVNTLLVGATALLALTGLFLPADTRQQVTKELPSIVATLIRGLNS